MKRGMKRGGGKFDPDQGFTDQLMHTREGGFDERTAGFGRQLKTLIEELKKRKATDVESGISDLLVEAAGNADFETLEVFRDIAVLCAVAFQKRDSAFFERIASHLKSTYAGRGSVNPEKTAFLKFAATCGDSPVSVAQLEAATGWEDIDQRTLRRWAAEAGLKLQPRGRPKKKTGI